MSALELFVCAYVAGAGLAMIAVLPAFEPEKRYRAAIFGLFWPILVPLTILVRLISPR